jgi:sialate O-acetylesterase
MKKLVYFLFLLAPATSKANISLPSVISSNMVLQQQSSVKFWGWADPAEKVYISPSWTGQTDSVVAGSDGKWLIRINTKAAGGPYTITIRGRNEITLSNVLIGEVWVCSGQSNMEMNYHWGLPDMAAELKTKLNPNLRFFTIPKTTARYPQENCRGEWTICDTNSLKSFSAVAYFFGKKLSADLGVPIGLINTSWGGTPADAWTPAEAVNNDQELKMAATRLPLSTGWPVIPGATFNAMIAPITKFSIAGAIWYQGEGNTAIPKTYGKTLSLMINNWRKEWESTFPFYFVQIAPFTYGTKHVSAIIREQQAKTTALPNTGMVVITDLVDDIKDIHPKNKHDVGLRLANQALANTYHQNILAQSPVFKKIQISKNQAIISFEPPLELMSVGKKIRELYIAGADRVFHPAQARIDKNQLIVWSKDVKQPAAVRFGFSNTAIGNLFAKNGLPVAPFRTDDWDLDLSPE